MRKIVVEISDRSGTRLQKVDFLGNSLSIGRAWGSDIILQDKFIDADHMSLHVDDGALVVTDLSSTNGSLVAGKYLVDGTASYRWGDVIRIGDTRIRIFDQSAGVGATHLRSAWFSVAEKFKSLPAISLLTLLTVAISLLSNWLFASAPLSSSDILVNVAGAFFGLVVWSLTLGTLSKVVRGESNFGALWVLACGAIILYDISSFLLLLLRFNLQDLELGILLSGLVTGLVICWTLVGVFTYTSHVATRRKWLWSILIFLTIYGFVKSDDFLKKEHEKWSAVTRTESVTLPPVFLWRKRLSIDEYQRGTDQLFDVDVDLE